MSGAISVIIPAHNAAGSLGDQLRALDGQISAAPFEVIVVANRCTDDTLGIAKEFRSGQMTVRAEVADDRASAGYARNVGARIASGDILLFCDADDLVGPSWVSAMTERLTAGQFDVVGGRLHLDRSVLPGWLVDASYSHLDGHCSLEHFGHRYAVTASMGCRREVFEALGGFDEGLPDGAGAEDADFGIRRSLAGFSFGEAPEAPVLYRPRPSLPGILERTYRYAYNGEALAVKFGRQDRPSAIALAVRPIMVMGYAVLVEHRFDPRVIAFRGLNVCAAISGRWTYHRDLRNGRITRLAPA